MATMQIKAGAIPILPIFFAHGTENGLLYT